MDIAYAGFLIAFFVFALRATGDYFFWWDDWLLVRQSGSFEGMVDQYNGHLSVVILAVYRVLVELFGLDYGPFRVVGLICLFLVPISYYLVNRGQLGRGLAAVLGLSFFAVEGISFIPAEL
ncbi:MAG: hypothetical protein ABIX10_11120, partial [Acidimicrobiales bacterium]